MRTLSRYAWLVALLLPLSACGTGGGDEAGREPGPLLLRARTYDAWHEANHQPFYGATVEAVFKDDALTEIDHYDGYGDSTIWTGTYLASQAFRYAVTRDPQAKVNAEKAATALHNHLKVTGRPGFIARYRGPKDLSTRNLCDPETDENCHVVEGGEFSGDLWKGDTSRDQYTGWFFGLGLAYDLLDDPALSSMIRQDVREVIDALIAQDYKIIDVDGQKTGPGPDVLPPFRVSWLSIAAHMLDEPKYEELFRYWTDPGQSRTIELANLSFFNRYAQYYGNNLSHQNAYSLHRLLGSDLPESHAAAVQRFERQTHRWVHLSHNAFFEAIHLAATGSRDPTVIASIREDLTAFRDAPNRNFGVKPPKAPLDPTSIILHELQVAIPILPDLMGTVNIQAQAAYPVPSQCSTDFLWQRNPFAIQCGGENLRLVNPGVDYLVAYWMSRYHRFIGPDA